MLGRSRNAAAQLATAVSRSFAVGPAGACSGVPEAALQRKARLHSSTLPHKTRSRLTVSRLRARSLRC